MIIFGILSLSLMDAVVKWMVMQNHHPIQLLAIRSWMIVLFFVFLMAQRGPGLIKTSRWRSHLGRGLIGTATPILFFLSLKTLPLAEATALFFSTTFVMTALSSWFLKEPVGSHSWATVIIGFIGVLLITNPGSEAFRIEALYVFGASLSYSILIVSGRWLSQSDSVWPLVFYFNIALLLVCNPLPLWLWQPMATEIWLGIVAFAILALMGHFGVTLAFKLAPVGLIAPFEYLALVWATLLGYVIWNDLPNPTGFSGMAVIVSCGIYILWRERRYKNSGEKK